MGVECVDRYKILEERGTKIFLVKFPNGKTDVDVVNVFLKPRHGFLKVECRIHGQNCDRTKPGLKINETMFFGGFSTKPKRRLLLSRAFHSEKIVVVREVSEIFVLRPIFDTDDEGSDGLSTGIQLMKIENKDELEHRRRNVNYLLKVFKKEDFVHFRHSVKDDSDLPMALSPVSAEAEKKCSAAENTAEKIRKIVFNARIVNLSELHKIAQGCAVDEVLAELAIPFKGRFVLKNEFYEKQFRATRKAILDKIGDDGVLAAGEVLKIPRKSVFLLDELCERRGDRYVLRGMREELGLEDGKIEEGDGTAKVAKFLENHKIRSPAEIEKATGIGTDDLHEILQDGRFFRLCNGRYALLCGKDEKARKIVFELFSTKQSVRKAEIFKKARNELGEAFEIDQLISVLEEISVQKGAFWSLKNDDG